MGGYKEKMRILHVSPYFSPLMGGAPRVVFDMAAHLSEQGHSVTVVAGDNGVQSVRFPRAGFKEVLLPCPFAHWGFYITPGFNAWIRKHAGEFDLFHLHIARTYQNIFARRTAIRLGIPYIISAHGTLRVIWKRKLAKRIYDQIFGNAIYRSAARWLAVSPVEVNQYQKAGVHPEKIRLLLNGFDLEEFTTLPRRGRFRKQIKGVTSKTKLILYLGRLHGMKGIQYLVRAFAQIRAEYPDAVLAIVGPDDGELRNLKKLAHQLRVEEIIDFHGPLYGIRRLEAMVDADILAAPGTLEIFGLVPFEALLCGTPVIVGDDCGTGQIIQAMNAGYTVPFGDENALAISIRWIFQHPDRARSKVIAGRKHIRHAMDWNLLVKDLERVYRETIGDRNGIGSGKTCRG